MHIKNVFIIRICATSLFKITYSSQSSQLAHHHPTHCQPAHRVQASVDYCIICDDPVSSQSLVSWVKRQSRLVSPKKQKLHILMKPLGLSTCQSTLYFVDIPISRGSTSLNRSGTLSQQQDRNTTKLKNNTPHWVPIVARVWSFRQ